MTGVLMVRREDEVFEEKRKPRKRETEEQTQLSLVAILLAAIKKSMASCRVEQQEEVSSAVNCMEIGWPTNVQHITHVTFDRFEGFLGLPVEFEVDVPCRAPSANFTFLVKWVLVKFKISIWVFFIFVKDQRFYSSQVGDQFMKMKSFDSIKNWFWVTSNASVFGVSPESMQCAFDSKGNSVPTILLLMQERLYSQVGLKAEGIFRINPENTQEEQVRDQLNRGIVPDNIDVHCLAGLIKAWFRELPEGILDGLSPEQVLECKNEEEFVELVKQLLPIQAALLNWAIELMADVVEQEENNKMNARNIAMVFAPNMTQMSDPLTALMHAVQVMNLLKSLILKTLREREENTKNGGGDSPFSSCSSEQQTDEEEEEDFDGQKDDEMETSCELRGASSYYYDNAQYSQSSEDEEEVDQLNVIEKCFLRQLKANEELTRNFTEGSPERFETKHLSSPSSYSGFNAESGFSYSNSKNMSSGQTSMSDTEDSSASAFRRVMGGKNSKFEVSESRSRRW